MLPIHYTFRACIAEALKVRHIRASNFYRDHAFNEFLLDVSELDDARDIAIQALVQLTSSDKNLADSAIIIGVVIFLDRTCRTDNKYAQNVRLSSLWQLHPSDEHAYRDWISRWYDD